MLLISNFLINLLCSAFNCDPQLPYPTSAPLIKRVLDEGPRKDPIVFTGSGPVEGYFMKVVSGRDIYAFEGIPFAEPPVGNLRFRAPIPKKSWSHVRSAKKHGPDCLQLGLSRLFKIHGREDCLYLNIYTPQILDQFDGNLEEIQKLPVIIYIHGGNFLFGTGREYGPAYLLQEDVILVTLNYRLSVLGFLSTGDEESLGNWGLRDQSVAIKWIHDNIKLFGGDNTRITITGQSAGGVSVHLQMMSQNNIARGLFTGGVSFSGSAFHHWGLQPPKYAQLLTNTLAQSLGCPINNGSKRLINCLRRIDGNFLVGGQRHLQITSLFPIILFAPVIEPNVSEAFITDTAENYYKNDLVMKIPFICTNVANETAFLFMALNTLGATNYYMRHYKAFMPLMLDYGRYVDYPDVATEMLTMVYFGNKSSEENGLRLDRNIFSEAGSDRFFTVANRLALRAHSRIAPTYSFNYRFRSESGIASASHHDYRLSQATHGDEQASLFNSSFFFKPLKKGSLHFEVSKVLVNLMANFARIGQPVYNAENGSVLEIWKPIDNGNDLRFLEIGTDGTFQMVGDSPENFRKLGIWQWLGIFKEEDIL